MLLSYGIGWRKIDTPLLLFALEHVLRNCFENINPIKKGLKKKRNSLFKSSSLISGLGFLLFFFFQSNSLIGLIPIGQKIGLYNTVNIR